MLVVVYYLGLDYHQNWIQACVMDRDGNVIRNFRCPNDVDTLLDRLGFAGESVHAAVECSTGAADSVAELIGKTGWLVDLAHQGYVSRLKQSPDKSDFSDARLLTDLVRVG